ncbi:unnamed protein product [Dimorphilus gyrociliatus]|uniref:Uncharacterized protein n=1 Tax=Dimorphilus gyrociliatus TaxID=2664684 RepID=A0A7I8VMN1_9ANNE|nr:unnamed protein product [Dimorphilus gyrociliatus]
MMNERERSIDEFEEFRQRACSGGSLYSSQELSRRRSTLNTDCECSDWICRHKSVSLKASNSLRVTASDEDDLRRSRSLRTSTRPYLKKEETPRSRSVSNRRSRRRLKEKVSQVQNQSPSPPRRKSRLKGNSGKSPAKRPKSLKMGTIAQLIQSVHERGRRFSAASTDGRDILLMQDKNSYQIPELQFTQVLSLDKEERSPSPRTSTIGRERYGSAPDNDMSGSTNTLRLPPQSPTVQSPCEDQIRVATIRRRSFSVSRKGVVNHEGDTVVSRVFGSSSSIGSDISGDVICRSRASSFNSQSSIGSPEISTASYKVLMIGAPGVGRTSLTRQFLTSEYIGAETSFGKYINSDNYLIPY